MCNVMDSCDLDLTFGLVIVTLSLKIWFGLYLAYHKAYVVNTWDIG